MIYTSDVCHKGIASMRFGGGTSRDEEIQVPQKELYLGEIEDMGAAIPDGTPNYLSLQESRKHIQAIVSLYSAAERNQVIYLE